MNQNLDLIGNIYYIILSLIIIFFACYTMFSMIGQPKGGKQVVFFNWAGGGVLVYGLGLWAMYVVSLLGSDFLIVIDGSLLYIMLGFAIITYMGISWLKSPYSNFIRLSVSSLLLSSGAALMHYLSMLSGEVVNTELNLTLFLVSILIIYTGTFASLYLFVQKRPAFKLASSIIIGMSAMALHLIGMHALEVEQGEIVTTDSLNDYLLILAFLLGIATLLICSFTLTTWHASRKYSEVNTQYKLLVENSLDTIAVVNYRKEWEFMNRAGLQMFEADHADSLLGKPIADFLHEKHHALMNEWFCRDTETDQAVMSSKPIEVEWRTVKGTLLYTEMVCTCTIVSGKCVDQMIIRDISERKKNEELLIKSEKLSIAGQLAAGIAHEIRNPLTSLKGFLQLIASGRSQSLYYDIMNSELVRIESVVSELLMLSKPQVYELNRQDVRNMLADTVTLMETEANLHNVEMVLQLEQRPLWIQCVSNQIKQVFINVVKNAIDAMPQGGLIKISAELEEDHYVKISIQDEGLGMDEKQLLKIGQPFYTTKVKGTGLGLMISYKIIINHQGCIIPSSIEGVGTTFVIRLPYAEPETGKEKAVKMALSGMMSWGE
ncbi:PAS domain S-box protein [Paenibacillus sp. NEAU-GSW1]|nr:PAS domain S-box protein [Paenibacillus sp. NEAU-GSW1]